MCYGLNNILHVDNCILSQIQHRIKCLYYFFT
nr:MAG TPA: hypothetical protein [Caudoviricetes sp.]